jgi:N-acetylmuramoyl-L-alanine amidase
MRTIDTIVIHCSASRPNKKINAAMIKSWHTDPYERPDGTLRYLGKDYATRFDLPEAVRFKDGRGWLDIGYHYVITLDGTLEDGRPNQQIGSHVAGYNKSSLGICLVGGLDINTGKPAATFTKEQMVSLRILINFLKAQYPTIANIKGHHDFPGVNKACPCFDVSKWLQTGKLVFSDQ